LVEASQVDWAGHGNDIASAMAEMHDLAQTMEYLKAYVQANPDTLVVLTADHSTGGLTIGARGDYSWHPEYLTNLSASLSTIASTMVEHDNAVEYVASQLGFTLTKEEIEMLNGIVEQDESARLNALKSLMDMRTNTGWTTSGHTGVDVEVFAFGAGHHAFMGQIDNTDIAKKIFSFIETGSSGITSNVELIKTGDTSDDDVDSECDFKQDWRCQ